MYAYIIKYSFSHVTLSFINLTCSPAKVQQQQQKKPKRVEVIFPSLVLKYKNK